MYLDMFFFQRWKIFDDNAQYELGIETLCGIFFNQVTFLFHVPCDVELNNVNENDLQEHSCDSI